MVQDVVRGGRLAGERTEDVARLLSSGDADRWIGEADLLVDLAHVLMLGRQGIVEAEHVGSILGGLLALHDGGLPASVFDPAYEDVHAGIEAELTGMVGEEAGGRLHIGRSRNDEVATCLRLRLRDEILALAAEVADLRAALVHAATAHVRTVMPGFTHLQPAQPTTLAHHLLAHVAALERDTARLLDAFARTNRSPLGSAAFAGTGYPIDRALTAASLGFSGILENTMDAVSSRDFALESLGAASVVMVDASRLADELVLWSSPLLGFVVLDDAYSSTSSIMPQKKNPDTMELVRAKASSVAGELAAALGIAKGLPLAYNRDLQELSPHLWRGIGDSRLAIRTLAGAVETATFQVDRLAATADAAGSTATELADMLVRVYHLPFRTAHRIVARAVRDNSLDLAGIEAAAAATAGLSLVERGLDDEAIARALDPGESVRVRNLPGGPSPDAVAAQLAAASSRLDRDREFVGREQARVHNAIAALLAEAREAAR